MAINDPGPCKLEQARHIKVIGHAGEDHAEDRFGACSHEDLDGVSFDVKLANNERGDEAGAHACRSDRQ